MFQLGVEKVVINTALDKNKELLAQIVSIFGSQAVVASIDYKKSFLGGTKAYFTSGSKKSAYYPIELAQIAEKAVGGELILNSLDRESTYQGYELEILKQVVNAAQIPVMISVGVSSKQDLDAAKQISAS